MPSRIKKGNGLSFTGQLIANPAVKPHKPKLEQPAKSTTWGAKSNAPAGAFVPRNRPGPTVENEQKLKEGTYFPPKTTPTPSTPVVTPQPQPVPVVVKPPEPVVEEKPAELPTTPPKLARLPKGVPTPSVPVGEAVTSPTGKPLEIDRVLSTYGWPADGWQAQFLKAADKADKGGRVENANRGDGLLTVDELRDFAYHPAGGEFLTSLALEQVTAEVGAGKKIADLPEAWMREVATQAAAAAGPSKNGVDTISPEALKSYIDKVATQSETGGAQWVTNQRVQVLYHSLARLTGESDAMDSPNTLKGTEMVFPAMTLAFDPSNNVAITASNTYFAADEKYSRQTERTDNFYNAFEQMGAKPEVFSGPATHDGRAWFDFKGSSGRKEETYDKGHFLANLNFNDPRDRAASFATENMHAQVPASNSGVWLHKVEMATREQVVKTNGRAVDVTGALFVDKEMNPLPPDQIPWISGKKGTGKKGDFAPGDRVPVPTHSWKAVLLQTGDNPPKFQARCYIVENRMDLDRSSEPKVVSLDEMQRILGPNIKLFQDLPEEIRSRIEGDPNAMYQPEKYINFISNDPDSAKGPMTKYRPLDRTDDEVDSMG